MAVPLAAQSVTSSGHVEARPQVRAVERTEAIVIDGRLDEAAWANAPVATNFTQLNPREGEPATQRTEVRFLYDADALYIGARMYDEQGAAGVRTRLARRDQDVESDYIRFIFDTFHDHTGRTILQLNPSGVKFDAGQASSSADPSWDPVWLGAAHVDSLGWTAELRIPFAQLRFPRDSVQTWGLQIWRYVERLNEMSMWSFWGKQEAGGPPAFGHLEDLRFESWPRGVEVLPYAVARGSFVQPNQVGSPFERSRAHDWRIGGDVKALLGSTLTLDATFNPDFGQVEADPAVVNLTAYETFYAERRPFFVEGSGLFGFGGFSCYFCSNVQSLSLFYSRRIGRPPQGSPPGSAVYSRVPDGTTILGAAKVTGRTAGGYQIGVLNAVTGAAFANIALEGGERTRHEVEPLTNYFVGRVRRNLRDGNLRLGIMATSVARRLRSDDLEERLPGHAEALGVDWNATWKEKAYSFMGNLALSQVSGSPEAMLRLQRASARYFDRPDREGGRNGFLTNGFDPDLTALRGLGGYMRLAKETGEWRWESATNFRTPGFEVNDLAFLTRTDYVWMNGNIFRNWTRPTRYYRELNLIAGGQQQYNFDGDAIDRQLHFYVGGELPNYWQTSAFVIWRPEVFEDRLTRGGPVVRRAQNQTVYFNLNTDSRKAVTLSTAPSYGWNVEGARGYNMDLSVRFKPATNLSVSAGPAYSRSGSSAQFVKRFTDPTATHFYGQRVVFADLVQRTLSLETRVAATFTPSLTVEGYVQPFVSVGDYSNFKEFDAPRSVHKAPYDAAQLGILRSSAGRDSVYHLDPDRDPTTANFSFTNPDFNVRSLRGSAVLRWEYRPGSTLYLVWQHQRSGSGRPGEFDFGRDFGALFSERADNIFVVKMSYWFGR
jgi:hypothetical protein